MRLGLLPC
ncbi:hypothetical protein LINPERHAP2_LOCUS4862 [Linum perenne]